MAITWTRDHTVSAIRVTVTDAWPTVRDTRTLCVGLSPIGPWPEGKILIDLRRLPDQNAPHYHQLCDIIESCGVSPAAPIKVALYVGTTLQIGIANQACAISEVHGRFLQVFTDEGDALDWLSRPPAALPVPSRIDATPARPARQ